MRTKQGGNLGSPNGRAKLKRRREPYWILVSRGCALGYRKGVKGGTWITRRRLDSGVQEYVAIGVADDLNDGNGHTYEIALAEARKRFGIVGASSGRATINDAFDSYLARLRGNNPASTVADTEARVAGILRPVFGKIALAELRAQHITRWRDKAAKTRKPDTVNRLLTILKAALNYAWREERLVADDSEWRRVSRLKGGGARKIFLTADQVDALLRSCSPAAFRDLVQAALLTGARYGELCVARVQDFDAATGTLEIRGGKTGARTVFLQDVAVNFFARVARGRAPDAWLLPRADGAQWGKNHHQKLFDRALKVAKLDPNTTFYALRHTHISLALLHGVNIKVLADNAGTSVRMIEQHYAKFLNEDRRRMFNQIRGLTHAGSDMETV